MSSIFAFKSSRKKEEKRGFKKINKYCGIKFITWNKIKDCIPVWNTNINVKNTQQKLYKI